MESKINSIFSAQLFKIQEKTLENLLQIKIYDIELYEEFGSGSLGIVHRAKLVN